MASLNKVMLIGRLTADPEEVRNLPNSGGKVIKFRMAVGRSRKNQQTGQWENDPKPLYIDCEVFTNQGQKRDLVGVVDKYVRRGDQIYVEGRLMFDQWEDKNGGGTRSKHKVVVDSLEMLGGGSKDEGGEGGGSRGQARGGGGGGRQRQQQQGDGGGYHDGDGGDDYGEGNPDGIPF